MRRDIPVSIVNIGTPQKGLARAREVFRREGVRGLLFKLLGEIFYRRLMLFERPTFERVRKAPLQQSLSFSNLAEDEIEEYCRFCPDTSAAEVKRRLAEGQLCFVLRLKGEIVHGVWATTGRAYVDYLSSEFNLRQDVAYIYDSFSSPEYRGRGLPLIRFRCMLPRLRAMGCRRVIAAIFPENKGGIRPPLKAGYRYYGTIGYIGVGKWRRYFCRVKKAYDRSLIYLGTSQNAS